MQGYSSSASFSDDGNLFNWKAGGAVKANRKWLMSTPTMLCNSNNQALFTGGDGIGNANIFAPSTSASDNNNLDFDPQQIETIEVGSNGSSLSNQLITHRCTIPN